MLSVFEESYDQDVGRASLNYVSLGVGFVIGLQISGRMQDRIYSWCKEHAVDPSSLRKTGQYWRSYRNGDAEQEKNKNPSVSNNAVDHSSQSMFPGKPISIGQGSLGRTNATKSNSDATRGLPEYRLPLVLPFSLLLPIGLFIYGWAAQYVSQRCSLESTTLVGIYNRSS